MKPFASPRRIGAIILGCALMGAPFLAGAQTASSTAPAASSTASNPGDGSSETPGQQQQRIRLWRHQSDELEQKISALGSIALNSLPMPVLFGVAPADLTPNFGDPRDGGTRTHLGEDIMAVKGTPIVSPTVAVVLSVGSGPSEGNTVSTANPGGETFAYMHLDRFAEGIAAGQILQPGALIGYVGNTGNAAGGPAHLHFEIHDPNNVPINPFPRLTGEFTPTQKIAFLNTILTQTSDPAALAQFLATNFHSTFAAASQAGVILPPAIVTALAALPAGGSATAVTGVANGSGDLVLGSSGTAVVQLQEFLISRTSGPAAARLAVAGATGNFGPLTQAALIEYQQAAGISPANGYDGAATRARIAADLAATTSAGTIMTGGTITSAPSSSTARIPTSTVVSATSGAVLSHDLHRGITSAEVQILQIFLNAHGFTVAASGTGSPGQETTYFGAATEAAVIKFQSSRAIAPAAGYAGPLTRAAINALLAQEARQTP